MFPQVNPKLNIKASEIYLLLLEIKTLVISFMIINSKISNYGRKSIQEELNQRKYKGRKESEDQQYRTLNKQQNLMIMQIAKEVVCQ